MSCKRVYFDTLRSLAFSGISASYTAIGSALNFNARILCITNDTNAGMILSYDNSLVEGMLFLPPKSYRVFDFTANLVPSQDDNFVVSKGTTWYVKYVTQPTEGGVYIDYTFGKP